MKTFEEKISRLEELSDEIRNPDLGIEDAISTFEEGIKLAKELEREIEKIEGKIQILMNSPLDDKDYDSEEIADETTEEKSSKKAKTAKKEKFDESELELDLFSEMSAPAEGLRQNV